MYETKKKQKQKISNKSQHPKLWTKFAFSIKDFEVYEKNDIFYLLFFKLNIFFVFLHNVNKNILQPKQKWLFFLMNIMPEPHQQNQNSRLIQYTRLQHTNTHIHQQFKKKTIENSKQKQSNIYTQRQIPLRLYVIVIFRKKNLKERRFVVNLMYTHTHTRVVISIRPNWKEEGKKMNFVQMFDAL